MIASKLNRNLHDGIIFQAYIKNYTPAWRIDVLSAFVLFQWIRRTMSMLLRCRQSVKQKWGELYVDTSMHRTL